MANIHFNNTLGGSSYLRNYYKQLINNGYEIQNTKKQKNSKKQKKILPTQTIQLSPARLNLLIQFLSFKGYLLIGSSPIRPKVLSHGFGAEITISPTVFIHPCFLAVLYLPFSIGHLPYKLSAFFNTHNFLIKLSNRLSFNFCKLLSSWGWPSFKRISFASALSPRFLRSFILKTSVKFP